jgi:hypothetical protein
MGKGRFIRSCREGDRIIQIWRETNASKPSGVIRAATVLLKQRTKRWTRFYIEEPMGRYAAMPWPRFKKLLKTLRHGKRVGPYSEQILSPTVAKSLDSSWNPAILNRTFKGEP